MSPHRTCGQDLSAAEAEAVAAMRGCAPSGSARWLHTDVATHPTHTWPFSGMLDVLESAERFEIPLTLLFPHQAQNAQNTQVGGCAAIRRPCSPAPLLVSC
jgi:hypothetical protein